MRRRQLAAALGAVMVLSLCACGKKNVEQPPAEASPETRIQLSEEDLGVVSVMARELSAAQMELITGSIEIEGGEAEDGGVKVTLVSAMGDGCYNCFNLRASLPEKSKIKNGGYGFESAEILFNDPAAPFEATAREWAVLEDDDPKDNSYSLRLTAGATRWDSREYILNNGITRTLKLKNIVSDDGKVLYEGQWSFDFAYMIAGESRELIEKPIPVAGVSPDGKKGESWAEISSLVLSNFSAECRYTLKGGAAAEPFSYGLAYMEMKSGEKQLIGCDYSRVEGKSDIRDYYLLIPIQLDEVKSIHLSDHVTVNVA